jgi:hypothetical protein
MFHCVNKADYGGNSYNYINDKNLIIHNSSVFNIITLNINKAKDIIEPITKVKRLTFPENPGIRNPITMEAIIILETSAKNLEIDLV